MIRVALLLDQSGSMGGSEPEVVRAANRFVEALGREPVDQEVMLGVFEGTMTVVRELQPLGAFAPLVEDDYQTGGDTALYDAIAETVRRLETRVEKSGRAVVAIVTDGQDTCSAVTDMQLRALLKAKRAEGWMFVFLSLDNPSLAERLKEALDLDDGDFMSGDRAALAVAMKQLQAKVRGFLTA